MSTQQPSIRQDRSTPFTSFNRGMSLEAIAARLGHRSLDMTLRYAKIANRTVAEEYFAVTAKVEALYGQATAARRQRSAPRWPGYAANTTACSATATAPAHPSSTAPSKSICETCTFFQTSIEFRPTLQRQHDDAAAKNQTHRADLFQQLLTDLDTPSIMINLTKITRIMPMSVHR